MTRRRKPDVFARDGGRGPALVLINGWSASGIAWPRAWVRELERNFRVIRIDNRGSGYSRFAPTPFTMADLADDVAAVLDDLELDRATVLGISMGGMIAQEFALRHADRLDSLVLVATRPPAPAYVMSNSSLFVGMLRPPARNETLEAFFTRFWAKAVAAEFAAGSPEAVAELARQTAERPTPRAGLLNQLRAANGWGHADRLRSITAATTIVHGTDDRLLDVANGRRLAELIAHARYVELAGVGHLPPLEAPDELLSILAGEAVAS